MGFGLLFVCRGVAGWLPLAVHSRRPVVDQALRKTTRKDKAIPKEKILAIVIRMLERSDEPVYSTLIVYN